VPVRSAPEGWLDGSLVFGREDGGAFKVAQLYRRSDEAWQQAGVTPIRLHVCRHSFASNAIAAGFDSKAIATYMGHSSIRITFDLYGKLLPGDSERAVAPWLTYFDTPKELPAGAD
jgi:integrase